MDSPDYIFANLEIKEWSSFIKHRDYILKTMSMNDALDVLLDAEQRMAAYPAMIETMQAHLNAHVHHDTPLPEQARIVLKDHLLDDMDYLKNADAKFEEQKQKTKEYINKLRQKLAQENTDEAFYIISCWPSEVFRSWEDILAFGHKFSEILPSPLIYFSEKKFLAPAIVTEDMILKNIQRHLKTVVNPWKKYANES